MIRRLAFFGDDLIQLELPDHTKIIKPPQPLAPLTDYREAVRKALSEPVGCPPLRHLVNDRSRVTIAFDDVALPLPPMKRDIRAQAIETICEELYGLGIPRNNIRLICAIGLHRKLTYHELERLVGRKTWTEFGPARIINHDAEDPLDLVHLGHTEEGYEVEVNRALVDSDLTIYVNVTWTSMNGGWKSYLVGLGTYNTIRAHHNPRTLLEGGTIMDPSSDFHRILASQGRQLAKHAQLLNVETVLDNRVWSPLMQKFLSLDRAEVPALFRFSHLLPQPAKSLFSASLRSHYSPVAVCAGNPASAHQITLKTLFRQQNVPVEEESDLLLLSLPNISPYSVFSRINPLLALNTSLGYVFNLHLGKPPVKKGGVLVLLQPFIPGFHRKHHPSYIEFYRKVLKVTRDPVEMEREFEEDFARRDEYINKYRNNYAYHGVHPFYVWYWSCPALKHLERIIVVGAKDGRVLKRLGLESARSLEEALRMASDTLGEEYSIVHLSMPPIFAARFTGEESE